MKYKIDQSVSKIIAPVLLVFEGTERTYPSGAELAKAEFDKYYIIDTLDAKEGMIVVTLKENASVNDIRWCGEDEASFL